MNSSTIIKSVESVTKRWAKQRKAEERAVSAILNRRAAMTRSRRISIKEAAWQVMEEAYLKASDGGAHGRVPASARQIMYAARRQILEKTKRSSLDSQYFTQTLLPEYMCQYTDKTAGWDVTYDARGHFEEPHTKLIVPVGTLDVRKYLLDIREHVVKAVEAEDFYCEILFPTCGPDLRFSAIMFIEKEGFLPLFKAVKLAERYDIAIISTKGMPVVACRHLADQLCGQCAIPLLVLHDFDKAGFSIVGTLQDVDHGYQDYGGPGDLFSVGSEKSKRYEFQHDIEVVDLGLRLEDVEEYGLESEAVHYRSDPSENLRENGATDEEIEFLCGSSSYHHLDGRRVELNAFTSGDFVEWIEFKLKKHGIKKVVPDGEILETAYRRAIQTTLVHEQLNDIVQAAGKKAEEMMVPKTLARTVCKRLKEDPKLSWDRVVAKLAADNLDRNP